MCKTKKGICIALIIALILSMSMATSIYAAKKPDKPSFQIVEKSHWGNKYCVTFKYGCKSANIYKVKSSTSNKIYDTKTTQFTMIYPKGNKSYKAKISVCGGLKTKKSKKVVYGPWGSFTVKIPKK